MEEANEANDRLQALLDADFEAKRLPPERPLVVERKIACEKCGDLLAWTWSKANKRTIEFNADTLFKKLAEHSFHGLEFKERVL